MLVSEESSAAQCVLPACERVKINLGDFDPKRKSLKVWRRKRRKQMGSTKATRNDESRAAPWAIEFRRVAAEDPRFPAFAPTGHHPIAQGAALGTDARR